MTETYLTDTDCWTGQERLKAAFQSPELWLCIGVDHKGLFWKRDIGSPSTDEQNWHRWDPDPVDMALKGETTALAMVEKLGKLT